MGYKASGNDALKFSPADTATEQEIHELDSSASDVPIRCKRNQCPLCLIQFDLEKCYVEHMLLVSEQAC